MYLSDHFNIDEASKDSTAIRLGIENTPPKFIIPNLKLIAENILEPIRDEYGEPFSPQSWYRCAELNQLLGGKSNSLHRQGLAVDLELLGWDNDDFAHWCAEFLDYDRIILEYHDAARPNSGWVHLQIVPDASTYRREFMRYDGAHYYHLADYQMQESHVA